MHNTYPENIQEHTLRVAMIAHALAIIRNRLFRGSVNPERAVALALYHDASAIGSEVAMCLRDRLHPVLPQHVSNPWRVALVHLVDSKDELHVDRLLAG